MNEWDYSIFQEKMGEVTEFGVIVGRPLSGKTELSNYLCKTLGYKVLDMKAIAAKILPTLGTEEEPWEEDKPVPIEKIEDDITR